MSIISKEVLELLNKHLNEENYSSHLYFNMSGWCAKNGLAGCSTFLKNHADEEHEHLEKINSFLKKAGEQPIITEMKAPDSKFDSVEDVFSRIVKHEQHITSCIKNIVEKAMENKDYISAKFLDWFLEEQFEEEELFNSIMDKIKLLGDLKGRNLYTFDKIISNLDKEIHK